ncbi:MAG: Uma2 family endonuclease [Hyphomicrobiaceae bacterium]
MPAGAAKTMTVDEFLLWQQGQEERYELIEGVPVRMMTGASTQHDRIAGNIFADLHNQLEGSPCWPATADVGIRTRLRSLRRADVLVTCDEPRADAFEAHEPKMVVEVLSPSNKGLGWQRKLEEYRQHPGLLYLLLVDSEQPQATLVAREGERWVPADFDGLEETIALDGIGCRLEMARMYRGVTFERPP